MFSFNVSDVSCLGASQARVSRTAAALWGNPVDVLGRVLDVARLAVHAVLCVDLQPLVPRLRSVMAARV
jgi:hypothetical protein